jgi:hypothetical protein
MTKKPHKAISALMVYSSFVAPKPTKKQLNKFYSAAETSDKADGRNIQVLTISSMKNYRDRFIDLNTFLKKGQKFLFIMKIKRNGGLSRIHQSVSVGS